MRAFPFIACFLNFCVAAAGADEKAPGSQTVARKFSVVGYLPYYELKSFDPEVAKQIGHLIYFSIQPTPTGGIDQKDVTAEALDRLRAIKTRHGTKIHIAVGGWGRGDAFGAVATNDERRARFIGALLKYCLENRLDGVDFDWEFPKGTEETAAYSVLLTQAKAAFRPHQLSVTVALAGSQELTAAAYQAVDRVHLMSYDHGGREHATFQKAQQDVEQFLARGVPKERLILGLPCYGRNRRGKPKALPYSTIVRQYHPAAEADLAGGYSFNGVRTVQQKTRYALEQGLGGIMMWEVGQDTTDETSLVRAIESALPKREPGETK